MKKIALIAFLVAAIGTSSMAQLRKTTFTFPDTEGYHVLKGDFHQHTIFSDGQVWPTTRVEEAYEEDLDIICLTEHIEHRPHLNELTSKDHNHSFELAKAAALKYGILMFQSSEITRGMPPGHLNVIDIQDANKFERFVNLKNTRDTTLVTEALAEAKKQGGFIFWNHTAYPTINNKSTWHPIHEDLKNKGLMMGIEIVNGERYEPTAFQWCLDYNLTIFSNSDVHSTMAQKRSADEFKVLTLVIAKEKNKASVMEALKAHRTIALWNNSLMGRSEHVEPLVRSSVTFRLSNINDKNGLFEMVNQAGIPFVFEFLNVTKNLSIRDDVPCSVHANSVTSLSAFVDSIPDNEIKVRVLNVFVAPGKCLETSIPVILNR